MKNQPLLKNLITLLLSVAGLSTSQAGQITEHRGNIYYDNGQEKTQLTTLGSDSQPALAPDGKHLVFIRQLPQNERTELWLMDSGGNNAQAIVLSQENADSEKNLTELNNPLFALNSNAVYFMSAAWVTSNAIHIIDLNTHEQHFVTDGNSLELVPSGKYKGYLIVSKHKYHKGGGSYDDYWLVSPQGKEIKSLGDSEEQVDAFIHAN